MKHCRWHPEAVRVARCKSCHDALCDACFRFTLNDEPACARCAYETSTRSPRRVALAVVFVSFASSIGLWSFRQHGIGVGHPFEIVFGAVLTLGIGAFIAWSGRSAKSALVAARDPDDELPAEPNDAHGGAPYRVHARRALLAVAPRVSGKTTAGVLFASFVAAALVLPASLHLPKWIEAEAVLGAWWLGLATTLTVLLYGNVRLRDDFVYFAPWDRPDASTKSGNSGSGGAWGIGDLGGVDGEGCAIVVVLGIAFVGAWLVVEIALPVMFLLFYAALMRSLRVVSGPDRSCANDLGKSLTRGVLSATVYVLPLAALAWAVGALHHR